MIRLLIRGIGFIAVGVATYVITEAYKPELDTAARAVRKDVDEKVDAIKNAFTKKESN